MRRDLNSSQSQTNLESSNNLTNSFRKEQANELLSSVILSNSLYGIATLIFSFQLDYNGNLLTVIYFIDSKLVLQLIHQLYYYRIFSNLNMKYNHTIIRITQIILEGCFLLMLNIYQLTNHQDVLVLSNIFPILNIFVSVILKINEGNNQFKQSVQQINLFYVFRHLAILFLTLFISLKLEQYFEMDWLYTLWLFWILFSLSASITIYFIFVVLALCIQSILEQNSRQKCLVITNVCILFFMISCTCMFFLIPIQILNYFNIGQYNTLIDATRIILIINQVIFSYFTIRFKQELIKSISSYLSLNDSINPLHTLSTQQGEIQLQQYNKQFFVESQVTEAHMQIPKLVKRISKTYFGFDDIFIDKNLKKQVEPQTTSDKKPSHHRAFSSQVQKGLENENDKIRLASLMNLKLSEGPDVNEEQPSLENKMNISEQQCQVSLSSVNQCCICFDSEPDALFMKCGHGGICYRCAIDMWRNSDECYLCRNKIERVLQIKIYENNKNLYKVIGAIEVNQKTKKNEKIALQVEQQ